MIIPTLEGLTLSKAVSAGRDHIVVPDVANRITLTPDMVTKLCDRARGIGAHGVIKISATESPSIELFDELGMKREPDDAVLRIAAHYFRLSGLVDLGEGQSLQLPSTDRTNEVIRTRGEYTTTHSLPVITGGESALDRGYDVAVTVGGLEGTRGGLSVQGQTRHIVVPVENLDEIEHVNLEQVAYDPHDTDASIVLVVPRGEDTITDFDGVERPISLCSIASLRFDSEAIGAAAYALRAWSGFAGPDIIHMAAGPDTVEVRLFESDMEVTAKAEIIAEFQLAGIAGES